MASSSLSFGDFSGEISYKPEKPAKMRKQYLMSEVLGEGTYGKVREAIDSKTLRRVAVKIINRRHLRKIQGAEQNIKREIAIQKKLKHKHVVELIETFTVEEKDKLYLVMELVNGGSLQELLEECPGKRMPEPLVKCFFRQLLEGLEYCHSKGVVHRDIKPSNLMVTSDGILKISDFGVAEELDHYQDTDFCTKSKGSPAFQAPEVASGSERFSGFKVDVWASGVTLYLLLLGRVPFEGSSLINLFENISLGEFHMPEELDRQLQQLLYGLLTVDHEARMNVDLVTQQSWMELDQNSEAEVEQLLKLLRTRVRKPLVLPYMARLYGEEFGEESADLMYQDQERAASIDDDQKNCSMQ